MKVNFRKFYIYFNGRNTLSSITAPRAAVLQRHYVSLYLNSFIGFSENVSKYFCSKDFVVELNSLLHLQTSV